MIEKGARASDYGAGTLPPKQFNQPPEEAHQNIDFAATAAAMPHGGSAPQW